MSFFSSSSTSRKSSKPSRSGSGSNSRSNPSSESKSRPKDGSKSSSTGNNNDQWNEWEWNPQWGRYWRSRQKPNGEWEYEYREPDDDDRTPRSAFIETGDDQTPVDGEVVGGPEFSSSPQAQGGLQVSSSLSIPSKYSSAVGPDPGYRYDNTSGLIPSLSHNLGDFQRTSDLRPDSSPNYGAALPMVMSKTGYPVRSGNLQQDVEEEYEDDDDDTVADSAQMLGGLQITSGLYQDRSPSYEAEMPVMVDSAGIPIPRNRLGNTQEEDNYYDRNTMAAAGPMKFTYSPPLKAPIPSNPSPYSQTVSPNTAYPPYASPNTGESVMGMSPSSEQAPTLDTTHIMGVATVAEDSMDPQEAALHGSFKVHLAKDFVFGRVFKILWTEPKGQGMATKRTEVISTKFGEQCYASIRRFVIYSPMQGHCLCLPILTYNRQGTAKAGAKPQHHAIIYTEGRKGEKPIETGGESKLLKKAIRMEPNSRRDQLHPTSRLNYAKIYTVEYNVKVSFIGRIASESVKYFNRDFNLVHKPLPEAENEYSDDNQNLHQLGEREPELQKQHERRDPEPQNPPEKRDTAPSHRPRGSHRDQQTKDYQHREKKKK